MYNKIKFKFIITLMSLYELLLSLTNIDIRGIVANITVMQSQL